MLIGGKCMVCFLIEQSKVDGHVGVLRDLATTLLDDVDEMCGHVGEHG